MRVDARFRRFLALLVAFALLATMAIGCAGTDDTTDDTDTGDGAAEVDFSVAMITDVGGLGDKSFNDGVYAGLENARDDLGVEIRAVESNEIADYEPNIDQVASAGYNMIFTVGFLMTDTTIKKAPEYEDVYFVGIDQFIEEPADNTVGVLFKEHEGAYLAGVVAGLATLDPDLDDRINDDNVIGFVGGMDIPPVEKFQAGFIAGARSVNPDVQVISLYTGDFDDPAKGKEMALSAIDQGADIVFAAAGLSGAGGVPAAQERGALFIGVDQDQYLTIPGSGDVMLTSSMKLLDVAAYDLIKSAVDGAFPGGSIVEFGLAEGGVALAPFHDFEDKISQEILDAIAKAEQDILSGAITVPASRAEL